MFSRTLIVVTLPILTLTSTGCGQEQPDFTAVAIPETRDIDTAGSRFYFTISPDDRWLLWYAPSPAATEIRILDLKQGALFAIPNPSGLIGLPDESVWTSDSRFCFDFLDFADPKNPRLRTVPERPKPNDTEIVLDGGEAVNRQYLKERHCADCHEFLNDEELFTKPVPAEHVTWNRTTAPLRQMAAAPSGNKVYFPKGLNTSTVTLAEYDDSTGVVTDLTSHSGRCARIRDLRVSPDGRYVAYTFSSGCTWVSPPRAYVYDLRLKRRLYVSKFSFRPMWNSTSDRLYFVYAAQGNTPGHIRYVTMKP